MSTFVTTPVLFNLPRPRSWEAWWAGHGFELSFYPQPSTEGFSCELGYLHTRVLVLAGTPSMPDADKPKLAQLIRLLNQTANSDATRFGWVLQTQQARRLRQYLVLRTDIRHPVSNGGEGNSWQAAVDNAWHTMCTEYQENRIRVRAVRALWGLDFG